MVLPFWWVLWRMQWISFPSPLWTNKTIKIMVIILDGMNMIFKSEIRTNREVIHSEVHLFPKKKWELGRRQIIITRSLGYSQRELKKTEANTCIVYLRSRYPFYIISYYIKWVPTSWTYSTQTSFYLDYKKRSMV